MKILTFTLIFIFYLTSHSHGEDLYLWSGMKGDEKVYLNQDTLRRLYRLENADDANKIISELKSRIPEVNIEVTLLGQNSYLLVNRGSTSRGFPNHENLKFQIPVYTSKKSKFTYFFDGLIIFRPKKGTDINEILSKEAGLKLHKKLLSGTYFCHIEDGEKVLTVANRIYETGLVEFSYPNYIPPVVKNHVPTDPNYTNQYYLNNTGQSGGTAGIDIKAQGAWSKTIRM